MDSLIQPSAEGDPNRRAWVASLFFLAWGLLTPLVAFAAPARSPDTGARERGWFVRSWETEDGLPHDLVYDVLATRDGFLWTGTSAGLARFDGAQFRTFGLHDGLKSILVYTLAEDRENALWVGTVGGGFSRYKDGRFTTYANDRSRYSTVMDLLADRDGSVWAGTLGGLIRWRNGRLDYMGPDQGLPRQHVRALAQDASGTVWVATAPSGLYRGINGQFSEVKGAVPTGAYCLLADRKGGVWAGTTGSLWHGLNNEWTRFNKTNGIPAGGMGSLAEDNEGVIWFTIQNGGFIGSQTGPALPLPSRNSLRMKKRGR